MISGRGGEKETKTEVSGNKSVWDLRSSCPVSPVSGLVRMAAFMGSWFVCSSSEEPIDQLTLQETLRRSHNGRRGPFRPGAAFTAVWTLDPRDPRVNGITEGGAGDGGQLGQRRRDAGLRRRQEETTQTEEDERCSAPSGWDYTSKCKSSEESKCLITEP